MDVGQGEHGQKSHPWVDAQVYGEGRRQKLGLSKINMVKIGSNKWRKSGILVGSGGRYQHWCRPYIISWTVVCSKPLVRLGSFRFTQSEWTRNRFGFGLYSHGLFRGEQIDGCRPEVPYWLLWAWVQPRKVGFRDESHQWGVEPRVLVQPQKVVFRDERLNRDVGPSSTPKSGVQRWKPSVGGWTLGLSSTRKVVLRDERYQWGVEPGCGS